MKLRRLSRGVFAAAVGAVAAFGLFTASAGEANAARFRPCICPHVYAPVVCDGGRVYSNSCFASCAGATGCVPGGFPTF